MYEFIGTVKTVGEVQTFPSGFQKRELVVEETGDGKWPNVVAFAFKKDNAAMLDGLAPGAHVRIGFAIDGREWTDPKTEKSRVRFRCEKRVEDGKETRMHTIGITRIDLNEDMINTIRTPEILAVEIGVDMGNGGILKILAKNSSGDLRCYVSNPGAWLCLEKFIQLHPGINYKNPFINEGCECMGLDNIDGACWFGIYLGMGFHLFLNGTVVAAKVVRKYSPSYGTLMGRWPAFDDVCATIAGETSEEDYIVERRMNRRIARKQFVRKLKNLFSWAKNNHRETK